jgi:hypothetical protein
MEESNYISEKEILKEILLPLDVSWGVSSVTTNESKSEITLQLDYQLDYAEVDGVRYPLYDFRKSRKWKHLDLWHYKTFLTARIPRYVDSNGKVKSVSVPWADV